MTPAQLDRIPDDLLTPDSAAASQRLLTWLHDRGLRLSLWDLEAERKRRGITRKERAL